MLSLFAIAGGGNAKLCFEGIIEGRFGMVAGVFGNAADGAVAVAQHFCRSRHFQRADEGLDAATRRLLEFSREGSARHAGNIRQFFGGARGKGVGEDAFQHTRETRVGKECGEVMLLRQGASVAQREQQQDFAEGADDGHAASVAGQCFVMDEGAKRGELRDIAKRHKQRFRQDGKQGAGGAVAHLVNAAEHLQCCAVAIVTKL